MNAEPVEGEPLLSRSKTTIGIFNRFNINQSSTFKGINGLCEVDINSFPVSKPSPSQTPQTCII
jgi:hypothetical protein